MKRNFENVSTRHPPNQRIHSPPSSPVISNMPMKTDDHDIIARETYWKAEVS